MLVSRHAARQRRGATAATSNALLQSRHGESLNDRASRLRFHCLHLSEDLPLTSLSRRLLAGLDPAKTWESENAVLLDLLGGDRRSAPDHLARHGRLELALLSNGFRDASLAQGLARNPARRLHGLSGGFHGFHGFHGSH